MDPTRGDDRIVAPKAELTRMFDKVAANDFFAICVAASDPTHPAGAATIFSGNNGTYSQVCRPFDAAKLPAFARMLAAARAALREACIIRGKQGRESYCLRPSRACPGAPTSMDVEETRRHPGFLAAEEGFATIAVPHGEDRSEPLCVIYGDEGGGRAKRLWLGTISWLNNLESMAARPT